MGDYITGVNWFPDKYGEIGSFDYALTWDGGERRLTRKEAAHQYRMIREVPEIATVFTVERRWTTETVWLCPWCGARPRYLEWDCDGPYYTADCGSDQCQAGRGF